MFSQKERKTSIWVPGQDVKPYTNMERLTTMIENLSLDEGEEEPTQRDNTSLEVKVTWKPGGGPQRRRRHWSGRPVLVPPVTWGAFKTEATQAQNMSPEGLKTGHYPLVLLI